MPDQRTKSGRRDLALLSLMYDTGARIQEIADLTPAMVRITKPSTIKLIGKGNKAGACAPSIIGPEDLNFRVRYTKSGRAFRHTASRNAHSCSVRPNTDQQLTQKSYLAIAFCLFTWR